VDVMMFVELSKTHEFLFFLNKESRNFLKQHITTIKNGFINNGLINYAMSFDFNGYEQLERLYFLALKRNICNRTLTLDVSIDNSDEFAIFNEIVGWIKKQ
jgi:hypothetical protein